MHKTGFIRFLDFKNSERIYDRKHLCIHIGQSVDMPDINVFDLNSNKRIQTSQILITFKNIEQFPLLI